jgi:hypothetical protein
LEEFIMELLDLASCRIHLSDRIVDLVFRSTSLNFANTTSVAALLSFQAFDNASISSGVIGGFGMRRAYQRERFLGKAFLILTLAHKLFCRARSETGKCRSQHIQF